MERLKDTVAKIQPILTPEIAVALNAELPEEHPALSELKVKRDMFHRALELVEDKIGMGDFRLAFRHAAGAYALALKILECCERVDEVKPHLSMRLFTEPRRHLNEVKKELELIRFMMVFKEKNGNP